MTQLFVLVLKYLSSISLSVHDVLQVRFRRLQLVDPCLKLY
jgi:hypothetical protein